MNASNNNQMSLPPAEDPRLDALLDVVLAPEAPPIGLVDRILQQTAGRLEAPPVGVLARIDRFYRWPRAVAALVVAAALVGIVFNTTRILSGAHNFIVVDRELAALPAYSLPPDAAPTDAAIDIQPVDVTMHHINAALIAAEDDLSSGLEQIEQHDGSDGDSGGTL